MLIMHVTCSPAAPASFLDTYRTSFELTKKVETMSFPSQSFYGNGKLPRLLYNGHWRAMSVLHCLSRYEQAGSPTFVIFSFHRPIVVTVDPENVKVKDQPL